MRIKQENGTHIYGQPIQHTGREEQPHHLSVELEGPESTSADEEVAQDLSMSQEETPATSFASES